MALSIVDGSGSRFDGLAAPRTIEVKTAGRDSPQTGHAYKSLTLLGGGPSGLAPVGATLVGEGGRARRKGGVRYGWFRRKLTPQIRVIGSSRQRPNGDR